ncbi:hypothetical protein IWQ60_012604, partial [Tieghemiomyces parasiticus]
HQFDFEWSICNESPTDMATFEHDYLADDRSKGFDLDRPLIRMRLVRFNECRHVLFFTFHHALLDAWSVNIVLSEVIELYHGLTPQPRTQFHDFLARISQIDQEEAAAFWAHYLADVRLDITLQFPTTASNGDTSIESLRHNFTIPLGDIQGFCRNGVFTLNSLLRVLWALTLSRYTGHTDEVTFGVL